MAFLVQTLGRTTNSDATKRVIQDFTSVAVFANRTFGYDLAGNQIWTSDLSYDNMN